MTIMRSLKIIHKFLAALKSIRLVFLAKKITLKKKQKVIMKKENMKTFKGQLGSILVLKVL